jgi:drug/metabolite transporter (DMT)-like permease
MGAAIGLFAIVVLGWGTTWSVTKLIVQSVPPLWAVALRSWIALAAVLAIQLATRSIIVPKREDAPAVLSVALLHMTAFATLVAAGLTLVTAGHAVVLAYTTPLWVAAMAPVFLDERLTRARLGGIAAGAAGLAMLFAPQSLDWADSRTLQGSALILFAATLWAVNIVSLRRHRWIATPFQLLLWQILISAMVLTAAAMTIEGWPVLVWTNRLIALLAYNGIIGTALTFWAMSMINKSLPALTTSLGILATPVAGLVSAALMLGERIEPPLILAAGLILSGIAIGTIERKPRQAILQNGRQAETSPAAQAQSRRTERPAQQCS